MWFFVTADYAFGMALERDAANVVKESGEKATFTTCICSK